MSDGQSELRSETAARWHDLYLKVLEYSKEFGQTTIRSLILINGGAIVVILPTVANIAAKNDVIAQKIAQGLVPNIYFFTVGLFFAVLAAGFGYFNYLLISFNLPGPIALQDYVEDNKPIARWKDEKLELLLMYSAIVCGVISGASFISGAIFSVRALGGAFGA